MTIPEQIALSVGAQSRVFQALSPRQWERTHARVLVGYNTFDATAASVALHHEMTQALLGPEGMIQGLATICLRTPPFHKIKLQVILPHKDNLGLLMLFCWGVLKQVVQGGGGGEGG